jgi:hypothetical protein
MHNTSTRKVCAVARCALAMEVGGGGEDVETTLRI